MVSRHGPLVFRNNFVVEKLDGIVVLVEGYGQGSELLDSPADPQHVVGDAVVEGLLDVEPQNTKMFFLVIPPWSHVVYLKVLQEVVQFIRTLMIYPPYKLLELFTFLSPLSLVLQLNCPV